MGYLTVGKSVVGIIERNLPKSRVFAKAENPMQVIGQDVKSLLKSLPQDIQGEAKMNCFKNFMIASMAKTKGCIGLDKKADLLASLSSKYSRRELSEIAKADTPEALSDALKGFMEKVEMDLPEVYTKWLCLPSFTPKIAQKGFDTLRKHILSSMQGKCSQDEFLLLASAKNENELTKAFQTVSKNIQNAKFKQGVPIEVEQAMYDFTRRRNDTFLDIYKAIKVEPTNPKVAEIENTLRTKYGIKFVDLANNEERANQILQAVELNVSQGRKIPDNIIVSKLLEDSGEALQHSNLQSTVLIEQSSGMDLLQSLMQVDAEHCTNPQLKNFYNKVTKAIGEMAKTRLSTEHPLHTVIHEFNHLGQNHLLAARFRRIPNEFESTYKGLSDYAATGIVGEIEAELLTKQQLAKLTADEGRLLEYLS